METNLNITPANEIASTTPAVETTGEPVTEQAPIIPSTPEENASAASEEVFPGTAAVPEAHTALIDNTPAKKSYVVEKTWPGLECHALKEPDDPAEPSISTATQPTGEPVTEQAPIIPSTQPTTAPKLPDGYGDLMEATPDGKHRFLRRDYVDRYAKEVAAALTTGTPALTAAAFRSAFLRDAKKALRRSAPVGLMLTTTASFEVQAIKLVAKNKAPALLVDMMHALVAAATDAETYQAVYTHLDSVYTYMLQIESRKGGDL